MFCELEIKIDELEIKHIINNNVHAKHAILCNFMTKHEESIA